MKKRTITAMPVPQGVIQEMLGGDLTIACTLCRGAARVPEDVVAVMDDGHRLVVCEDCTPRFRQEIKNILEKMMEEPS